MQVSITGRHNEIDDSVKKYIMKKLSKLEKYTKKIIEVKVILDIQRFRHIAELVVVMKDKNMVVKEEGEGWGEVFDFSLDSMEKRLRRYWGRRKRPYNKK